jgi:hypothetical protein
MENSQANDSHDEKKHIDELADKANPYILLGALFIFALLKIIGIFIKK